MIEEKYLKNARDDAEILLRHSADEINYRKLN